MVESKYQYPIDLLIFNKESGIYKITDVTTGLFYIGATDNLYRRLRDHCRELQKGISLCRRLQESYNVHFLIFNFKFELLELCNVENLEEREQYYLDTLLFAQEFIQGIDNRFIEIGLNTNPSSTSPLGSKRTNQSKLNNSVAQRIAQKGSKNGMFGKTHSLETKAKIGLANRGPNYKIRGENHYLFKKSHSEETKAKISAGGLGRVVSNETRLKNSIARKGKKHTNETKLKISNTKKLKNG